MCIRDSACSSHPERIGEGKRVRYHAGEHANDDELLDLLDQDRIGAGLVVRHHVDKHAHVHLVLERAGEG
eukprot:11461342-Alexandrium_andersonii.AAC.1